MDVRALTQSRQAGLSASQRTSHTLRCHCRRSLRVRSYGVDTEAERARAPNAPPGSNWSAPPPPPPPPPPPRTGMQAPNRREALFGFLGAGLGTAITAAYYNTTYDLSEDSYEKALDALLDDEDFLATVADEALYREYDKQLDNIGLSMDTLQDIDSELKKLQADLERMAQDEAKK